jgi:protein phosphatase
VSHFRWTSAALTHVGRVRKANEDACLERPENGLWAVADGMGGHACGAYASRVVIETLDRTLDRLEPAGDLVQAMAATQQSLREANDVLLAEAALRGLRIIGSTAVVLLCRDRHCGFLWAGDSRLYRWRHGQLQQMTRDHSLVEEFKSRADAGLENGDYPPRNLLTRAVGATDTLEIDQDVVEVEDGDVFLLCSDGLSNEVGSAEIGHALTSGSCRQAAEILVRCALDRGGRDNVTVVVVRADDAHGTEKTELNPAL